MFVLFVCSFVCICMYVSERECVCREKQFLCETVIRVVSQPF